MTNCRYIGEEEGYMRIEVLKKCELKISLRVPMPTVFPDLLGGIFEL